MLPSVIGLIYLNIAYEEQIRNSWLSESEVRLTTMQDKITNIHLDLNSMLVQVRHDDAFSPNRIRKNSYHTMLAMLQLRRYQATNSVLKVLAYAEMPQGLLLSNISSDDQMNFTTRFFDVSDVESDLFWYNVNTSTNDTFSEPLMVVSSATGNGNVLVYAVNLRDTRVLDTHKLLVLLDALAIETQLASALPMESAGLLITNREGQLLLSSGTFPAGVYTYLSDSFMPYQAESLAHLQDYLITHSVAANGWNYFMFLSTTDLLQEVRGVTQLYSLFGLVFAGVSILFFALCYKLNFLPLRRFVRMVHQNNHTEMTPPTGSEYELIYAGYQALVRKTDSIQRQLNESYPIRRSYLLNQLISGNISEKEGLEQSRILALDLDIKRHYTVVLLFAADGEYTVPDLEMQKFLQGYLSENKLGHLVENVLDDAFTILLALPFPEQEAHKLEVIRIQAALSSRYQFHSMACMGGNHSLLSDICLSFQEAVRTSRYRNISNKNNCITFLETGEDSAFSRSYPIKMIQSFYHALMHESPEAIVKRMREIERLMDGFAVTHCRCIYCDLAFGIFHYFQAKSPVPSLSTELLDDITRALETQEMREIQQLMKQLERNFLDISIEKVNPNLIDRARQYIDSHFHESSLSIVELAEALGVSTGHLSRSYKKDTGETLLNYINTKRIDKAKKLLLDTDMPFHEIVHAIGYLDVSSFHRKFKSTVGFTPGAYRDRRKN